MEVEHRGRRTTTERVGAAASPLTRSHTVGSQEYRIGLGSYFSFFLVA